ncbi:MAG: hypothetical protein IT580_13100, partial [Verrucomicrobiales bacterium]|nr:hypothetical protein [Verrucomicrobiales bacterium]
AFGGLAQDAGLVGIWTAEDDSQTVELLFRANGRYQLDTRSTDPVLDFSSSERGRYAVLGQELSLAPYEYFGEPGSRRYVLQRDGDVLTLTRVDLDLTYVYRFKPGSRAEVMARERTEPTLVGAWGRDLPFSGTAEYTFRPGGYYHLKNSFTDDQFPPEFIRGRYQQAGAKLVITPYSGTPAEYEIDVFGSTLTVIRAEEFSGDSTSYELVAGSEAVVRAKAAEAEAFLQRPHWQVGVWEIRNAIRSVDLTLRPDGHYTATNSAEFLRGLVRGRYTLGATNVQFMPFTGQALYARDNGELGNAETTREYDYYDGELQLIDTGSISQSVTLARKRAGSEEAVLAKVREAAAVRQQEGWHVGIWEVHDPSGWMEFTFRPDGRYLGKSGVNGVPSRVERGEYFLSADQVTLAPYSGQGAARGFEWDLYDGEWFLIGDALRMVVARKIVGSETGVIEKTLHPVALLGERGTILGRWTADLPGQSTELVFRPDGEFRLSRCAGDRVSRDYGLYRVDMEARTLVSDSRFLPVQQLGLDFYGDTLTLYGGTLGAPSTYTVNLGTVDAAIEASLAADAEEALVDAQWLARLPVGPRDPEVVHVPVGTIPADPRPGQVFADATVLTQYQGYQRLSLGVVYFNELGTIRSVSVVNSVQWHFLPTGRVLVRFTNHRAGAFYPTTIAEVTENWGAYRVEPKPTERDILHRYADYGLSLETDLGEAMAMTLEDGGRYLFLGKAYSTLSAWSAEQKPIPCTLPAAADPSLMNTGLALTTSIPPQAPEPSEPIRITLTRGAAGEIVLGGMVSRATTLVVERAASLVSPGAWVPVSTNPVVAGAFSLPMGTRGEGAAYFRVRNR